MIYCPKCGIANREGSRFCNDCGTKLPSSTSVRCPQCGTPNPPNNVFCEQCNTRLVPTLADDAPESEAAIPGKKGLSLPTKPASTDSQSAGDWLGQLRSSMESASETEEQTAAESTPAEQPDWLSRLTELDSRSSDVQSSPVQPSAAPPSGGDEVPDWLTALGIINPDDAQVPAAPAEISEWLNQVPPSAPIEESPPEPEPAAYLSSLRQTESASTDDDVPDWLRELGTAPLGPKAPDLPARPIDQPTGYEEEIPEWLQSLGTGALVPPPMEGNAPAAAETDDWLSKVRAAMPSEMPSVPVPTTPYDEETPEWLRNLGTGPLRPLAAGEPPSAPIEPAEPPVEPWLAALRATTPIPAEEMPDWLRSLGTGALTLPGVQSPSTFDAPAAESLPSDAGDWLNTLRAVTPEVEEPPATRARPELEDVPDWLKRLGTGALTRSESLPAATEEPIKPATGSVKQAASDDWLSALRGTAPEPVETLSAASQPEAEEVPDWLIKIGTGPLAGSEPAPAKAEESIEPRAEDVELAAAGDWLSALREAAPEPTEIPSAVPQPESMEVPEWLMKPGTGPLTEFVEPVAAEDWLSALRGTAPEPVETLSAASQPEAEGVPDWLIKIGTGPLAAGSEPAPAKAEESIEPTAEATEPAAAGDWLSALREAAPEAIETPPAASQPESMEVPEWLMKPGTGPLTEFVEPVAAEDWLSALRAAAPEPIETPAAASQPEAMEVPEWLATLGTGPLAEDESAVAKAEESIEPTAEAVEPVSAGDWLSALREAAPEPIDIPAVASQSEAMEVPEWLMALGTGPLAEAESAATRAKEPIEPKTEAVEPMAAGDWLSALRETAPEPVEPQPVASQPDLEEVPEWLRKLGTGELAATESVPLAAEEPIESKAEAVPLSAPAAEVIPDWLLDVGAAVPPSAAIEQAEQVEPVSGKAEPVSSEVPDWLRDVGAVAATPAAEAKDIDMPDWLREAAPEVSREEVLAVPAPSAESVELPDWLREPSATGEAEHAALEETLPAETTADLALSPAELPDWLTGLRPEASTPPLATTEPASPERLVEDVTVSGGVSAISAADVKISRESETAPAELPDWLKSLRTDQPVLPAQPLGPVPALTQAEIPSWLEALRPQDGAAEPLVEVPVESEKEGVLAGLPNVLPAMPGLSAMQGSAAQLRVEPSADDLARAGIFQELLSRPVSAPTPVTAVTGHGARARRRLIQWLVAGLLFVVVSWPFIFDRLPFLPVADALPSSPVVQSAVEAVAALPSNAKVLVVFDYDATQAGEMNQIAEMVLRHLQARQANVTTASLNPQGVGLARSVWASIGVAPTTPTIFTPGQAVGVQSLLLNSGPYELVVDLSATSDNVRWWVEQIAVNGLRVKFVAGVSAAAESLALPYAQSKQIAGLIGGAVGAIQYAHQAQLLPTVEQALQAVQVAQRTKQAPSAEVVTALRNQIHLESQTLAHWFMIVVIVIGLITGLATRAGRRSSS